MYTISRTSYLRCHKPVRCRGGCAPKRRGWRSVRRKVRNTTNHKPAKSRFFLPPPKKLQWRYTMAWAGSQCQALFYEGNTPPAKVCAFGSDCSAHRAEYPRIREFACSRAPHVHPRGLGSRPSSLRGPNEEFYKKKLKTKSYGSWKIKKSHFAHKELSSFCDIKDRPRTP